jgi:nitrogen fixation NifU-like protein
MRVEDGVVREARFKTYGCPVAIACSEASCMWSEGKSLEALREVTAALVEDWLGDVPLGKKHVPELAVRALTHLAPVEG